MTKHTTIITENALETFITDETITIIDEKDPTYIIKFYKTHKPTTIWKTNEPSILIILAETDNHVLLANEYEYHTLNKKHTSKP